MNEITIEAEREEVCNVRIGQGILSNLSRSLEGKKPFLLTDENVFRLYGSALLNALKTEDGYTMSAGEASKTPETLLSLLTFMAQAGVGRNHVLIAVGGGVVLDLGGLAAALYMRGIDFLAVPTTLLADVDAAIGGKSAVDYCGVKNLLGVIRQPRTVLIDPDFLKTLPRRELVCGLGEMVKHAALSGGLFEKLCAQEDLFDLDFLFSLIPENVRLKAEIVGRDPFDRGARMALNLGHTTAHAIEMTNGGLSHGACVLCGIVYEAELAKRFAANCDGEYLRRLEALCARILPFSPKDADVAAAARLARFDKKNGEGVVCICPAAMGEYTRLELPFSQYEGALCEIRRSL